MSDALEHAKRTEKRQNDAEGGKWAVVGERPFSGRAARNFSEHAKHAVSTLSA